ncbi:IclR family transcriptional regulator [Halosimplex aquaticum]|uniref:IclR family transcriptional regulator n=1 Tax=Halosimplex aquaticum TaxID=3026162 RepID=A0ABD5Y6F1_9EURY|nr:IclR family transcriptional regulator [Halosimplex aquaticum]
MTNAARNDRGRTIRSVEIAFNIIDVLQEKGGAGVTELADELDHSKSTIHSHLRTLEDREILVREGDGYRLSLRILDMATHVRDQVGNYDVIRSEVDTLAEETGEIAQFGIEEHGKVSYLYKTTGERGVETASRVGTQQPMYSTSLGKTILAYLPEERTEEIVHAQAYEALTPMTITSAEELYEDLEAIRERGYGIDDEENFEGLRCVAAPVKNEETVLGAVSITGPSSRFTVDRIHDELSDQVQRAANVIELNTKFA